MKQQFLVFTAFVYQYHESVGKAIREAKRRHSSTRYDGDWYGVCDVSKVPDKTVITSNENGVRIADTGEKLDCKFYDYETDNLIFKYEGGKFYQYDKHGQLC